MPGFARSSLSTRPVWAEISRTALLHNYGVLLRRARAIDAELICVIKANAYGHGAAGCLEWLHSAGARWFAVTSVAEAVPLVASAGFAGRMLALSGLYPGEAETAVEHGITPVLASPDQVRWLHHAAQKRSGRPGGYSFHLEVDTGMARQGVRWDDQPAFDAMLGQLGPESPLQLESVMTHLASPDEPASPQTAKQVGRFAAAVASAARYAPKLPAVHCGNSTTLLDPEQAEPLQRIAWQHGARLLLRPGIALYGYGEQARGRELRPVLAWKTQVTALRTVEAGEPVSYNAMFVAQRRTRIALLPVGYADGYNRLLSNRGEVLIRGRRAPIAGRVTMDQTMVDVTDIPEVDVGEEVVLIGQQEREAITADDLARMAGTISYEVLCAIGSRVPRVAVG